MQKNKEPVFAERLRYAMQIRTMTAAELCRRTGLRKGDISNYRYGYYKPTYKAMLSIADVLNVAPEWLDGYDVPMEREISNVSPLLSDNLTILNVYEYFGCGKGEYNDGHIIGTIALPTETLSPHKKYFASYAKGDSMIEAGIEDGDLVVFEENNVPEENKIGLFCIDNDYAICKRYRTNNGQIFLLSENKEYAPILIDPSNECFRQIGILKKIIKDVK